MGRGDQAGEQFLHRESKLGEIAMADEKGKTTVQGPASTGVAGGATRIFVPAQEKEPIGAATRIYAAPDLGQTRIYTQAVPKRDSIYGWLVAPEGPDPWVTFTLRIEDAQYTLGSDGSCEFHLADQHAAARHASIRMKSGVLTITDLDSEAGTMVNGEPVTKVELRDGDVIRLGSSTLKFRKL